LIIPLMLADAFPTVLAAATAAPATQAAPGWASLLSSPLIPIALIFIIMMSFMNRGKRTKDKERESMLKQLKKGDRVQTIGGMLGVATRVEDGRVEVKVDEGTNTKIWFTRSAIHQVLDGDKAEVAK